MRKIQLFINQSSVNDKAEGQISEASFDDEAEIATVNLQTKTKQSVVDSHRSLPSKNFPANRAKGRRKGKKDGRKFNSTSSLTPLAESNSQRNSLEQQVGDKKLEKELLRILFDSGN